MEEKNNHVKFVDLFAGIGGLRLGFEKGFKELGFETECVLTSEIKESAVKVLKENFDHNKLVGDIREVETDEIPKFDFLLAGFPCQSFSAAGHQDGFADTRGTLFFEIERILREKQPYGFLLENVEGLVTHDRENKEDEIGNTLKIILNNLSLLGYNVNYEVLDAQNFGLPQSRKRVYIVGTKEGEVELENFPKKHSKLKKILERGLEVEDTEFNRKILENYSVEELHGKAIKDKRGGDNNIHSWDIELKGPVSDQQKKLLNELLKQRRRKKWAKKKGIKWMDGMPLTVEEISTFYPNLFTENIEDIDLKEMLDDLVEKGYLELEHPKKQVEVETKNGNIVKRRRPDKSLKKGYNIVTGKLSFEFTKILDPEGVAPTVVATDVHKLAVPDEDGLRELTLREGLRLFGYNDNFIMNVDKKEGFDLLGNTVPVPVVEAISDRLAGVYNGYLEEESDVVNKSSKVG